MEENDKVSLTIESADRKDFRISISGRLDLHTTADIWQSCLDLQTKYLPESLTIDMRRVSYCDSVGIALLLELKKRQQTADKKFSLKAMSQHTQDLMDIIEQQPGEIEAGEIPEVCPTETVGAFTFRIFENIKENIIFVGMLVVHLGESLLHPKDIRWLDFWRALEDIGPKAFPIITLIGFLVGLISAFQAAIPLGQFGAQIYIADLVGIGLVREMGPLMTAVLLAGRTASSFAAELGTMKINQEIDALTTMGLDSVKFLTIPRVFAAILMTPLLNVFLIFFGLVGCGIVMNALGYNFDIYTHQLYSAISFGDFMSGLVKTFAFGIVVASVGCLHGIKTRLGASAVGYSTTQAVVSSLIMIVIVDGIFASIYYVLGI